MIKRLLCLAVLITALSSLNIAQTGTWKGKWTKTPFGNPLVDTLKGNTGAHGVTVSPDGKIWVAPFKVYDTASVYVTDSAKYLPTKPVWVFNPDGSPASFSPIKGFTKDGKTVALGGANIGIQANKDGNVILSNGTVLYMFDYKTGAGLARFDNSPAKGMNKPAVDDNGNVFISHVEPGYPIKILKASDLTVTSNAIDTLLGYGRTLEVSKDGNTIYAARYDKKAIWVYSRQSDFDPFKLTDTLGLGFSCESLGWNPANGLLYAASGSTSARPQSDPAIPGLFWPQATPFTHYGIDVTTKTIKDSISCADYATDALAMPRGIAFSPDGKTAYVCEYNNSSIPCVQKLVFNPTESVEKENGAVVNSYALSQNFPNPFNPSTEIKFSVAKDGFVTLKVYDMLGKEVATLVNEQLTAGKYSTQFNASSLSSGMYIYQLNANGNVLNHKMTLLK